MADICITDIRMIERLLIQCSSRIERYASKTSPDQDLCRRCNRMVKKLDRIKIKSRNYE